MQIRYEIEDNGDIQLACFCLKTDSWLAYLAFKREAREAFVRQDVKAYARYLQAALLCLFAHTEAVVNEICDKLKPALKNKSLGYRISIIVKEAKKVVNVPPIVFDHEKKLRDMLAHPGVEKSFDVQELQREFRKIMVQPTSDWIFRPLSGSRPRFRLGSMRSVARFVSLAWKTRKQH